VPYEVTTRYASCEVANVAIDPAPFGRAQVQDRRLWAGVVHSYLRNLLNPKAATSEVCATGIAKRFEERTGMSG
jgi:hypothetical protein